MGRENPPRRKYELKQRAAAMAETRQRIAEAAVDLHGTIGPARTTMSAVAERAGVQRHTLYRHFPTEADLFRACSTHFFSEHPLPDIGAWRGVRDPRRRVAQALDELYAYYQRTEPMFRNVLRDAELVDAMRPVLAPMQAWLDEAAGILATGWGARGGRRRLLVAATRHAVDFQTWCSLTSQGQLKRAEAIELTVAMIRGAARRG